MCAAASDGARSSVRAAMSRAARPDMGAGNARSARNLRSVAAEAAAAAIDLEPDTAAAAGALDAPVAGQLVEEPQAESARLVADLRVEPGAAVGDLDMDVVAPDAREEDDLLPVARRRVADRVPHDLGDEQRDRVGEVVAHPPVERVARCTSGTGYRVESQQDLCGRSRQRHVVFRRDRSLPPA